VLFDDSAKSRVFRVLGEAFGCDCSPFVGVVVRFENVARPVRTR
jgi:hypothetical protein